MHIIYINITEIESNFIPFAYKLYDITNGNDSLLLSEWIPFLRVVRRSSIQIVLCFALDNVFTTHHTDYSIFNETKHARTE